jgi:N-acetyl-anhydromuramyl-L-alanine amidase AmpD
MEWLYNIIKIMSTFNRRQTKIKFMKKLDISKIKSVALPADQYKRVAHKKIQIFIHHTVSGPGVMGDINWWNQTEADVATCVIIDRKGVIHQAFSSRYWAHHLGIKSTVFRGLGLPSINSKLNKESVGIEIDSWGGLTKDGEDWKCTTGKIIPSEQVQLYPDGFRGYYAFEKYTSEQIEATRQLIVYWGDNYNIPLDYKGDGLWDMSNAALTGEGGVWTHVSVRPDKSDCHPQPELLAMLKGL